MSSKTCPYRGKNNYCEAQAVRGMYCPVDCRYIEELLDRIEKAEDRWAKFKPWVTNLREELAKDCQFSRSEGVELVEEEINRLDGEK